MANEKIEFYLCETYFKKTQKKTMFPKYFI